MKRNKKSTRAMRNKANEAKGITKGSSPYAKKVAAGNQMYGPGCCAHKLAQERMEAIRRRVKEEERRANLAAAA